MKHRETMIPPQGKVRLTEALERLGQLYEATGKKDEAAKWRKELDAAKAASKNKKQGQRRIKVGVTRGARTTPASFAYHVLHRANPTAATEGIRHALHYTVWRHAAPPWKGADSSSRLPRWPLPPQPGP
jgi:hypothetical protein